MPCGGGFAGQDLGLTVHAGAALARAADVEQLLTCDLKTEFKANTHNLETKFKEIHYTERS